MKHDTVTCDNVVIFSMRYQALQSNPINLFICVIKAKSAKDCSVPQCICYTNSQSIYNGNFYHIMSWEIFWL